MAGPATLHEQIASQYAPADDLPCADAALLVPLKKSPEYRTIRPRVASPRAIDSWQEDGLHFFVFQLRAVNGVQSTPADPPVAVFCMHTQATMPISAVVVTPSPSGEEAEIMNLREPESVYIAPVSP